MAYIPGNRFIRGGGYSGTVARRGYDFSPQYMNPLNGIADPHPEYLQIRGDLHNVESARAYMRRAVEYTAEGMERDGKNAQAMSLRAAAFGVIDVGYRTFSSSAAKRFSNELMLAGQYIQSVAETIADFTYDQKYMKKLAAQFAIIMEEFDFTVELRKQLLVGFLKDIGGSAAAVAKEIAEEAKESAWDMGRAIRFLTNPYVLAGVGVLSLLSIAGGPAGVVKAIKGK